MRLLYGEKKHREEKKISFILNREILKLENMENTVEWQNFLVSGGGKKEPCLISRESDYTFVVTSKQINLE